jgi:hypothetical protein
MEVSGQLLPGHFIARERTPITHGRLGSPRAGLDIGEENVLDSTKSQTPTPRLSSPKLVAILTVLSLLLDKLMC